MRLTESLSGVLQFDLVADLEDEFTAAALRLSCPEHGHQEQLHVRLDLWRHEFVVEGACCKRLANMVEVMVEAY